MQVFIIEKSNKEIPKVIGKKKNHMLIWTWHYDKDGLFD
jgi:hypothetical protein